MGTALIELSAELSCEWGVEIKKGSYEKMIKGFDEIRNEDLADIKIEYNYHTHNYLCGHADGTVSDYVKVAVGNGLKSLGVSDHFAQPALPNCPYMNFDKLKKEYLPQFDTAEALFGERINIYSGLEVEYFSGYDDAYEALLREVDYLVLGEHYYFHDGNLFFCFRDEADKSRANSYFAQLAEGVKSGYFSILAHPDLIFFRGLKPDNEIMKKFEDVIRCCVDYGVKTEINAQGVRANGFGYPTDYLLEICEKLNAPVVVSSDGHFPEALCDSCVKKLYYVAKSRGLNIAEDGFIEKRKRV